MWQIASETLYRAMDHQDLAPYLKKRYVGMIQCFLLPEKMIQRKETPSTFREDDVVLELTPGEEQQTITRGGKEMDPVYELFMPSHPEQQGIIKPCMCTNRLLTTMHVPYMLDQELRGY